MTRVLDILALTALGVALAPLLLLGLYAAAQAWQGIALGGIAGWAVATAVGLVMVGAKR